MNLLRLWRAATAHPLYVSIALGAGGLAVLLPHLAFAQLMNPITILNAATATSTTPPITACAGNSSTPTNRPYPFQSFQFRETGTGTVTATIQVMSSNDAGTTWTNYGAALTISGTSPQSVSAYASAPFDCFGAIVTAITGTNASITGKMDVGP